MKYELAKKLNDAGFVQSSSLYSNACFVDSVHYPNLFTAMAHTLTIDGKETEVIMVPTLSELIEACGDRFEELRVGRNKFTGEELWSASEHIRLIDDKKSTALVGVAESAEEAVANLWLALQNSK